MSTNAASPGIRTTGRELADRLKREAREELPLLLALWDAPPEPTPPAPQLYVKDAALLVA